MEEWEFPTLVAVALPCAACRTLPRAGCEQHEVRAMWSSVVNAVRHTVDHGTYFGEPSLGRDPLSCLRYP